MTIGEQVDPFLEVCPTGIYADFLNENPDSLISEKQFNSRKHDVLHRGKGRLGKAISLAKKSKLNEATVNVAQVLAGMKGHIPGQEMANLEVMPPATDEDYDKLFSFLEQADEVKNKLYNQQASTRFVAPKDGLPIAIAFTGDWHLGAGGVLYKRLREDLELIKSTDGLYAIGTGDYRENVKPQMKPGNALYSGLMNEPGLQNRMAVMRAGICKGKWLAIADGNHDAWDYAVAGISNTPALAAAMGAPFFGEGGGTVYTEVGGVQYAIGMRHNHPGNSRLNTSNAQRRAFDEWPTWDNMDVICLAHFHFNDMQKVPRKGASCVYLRSGTYKAAYTDGGITRDGYAAKNGFVPEYGVPLVVLYPDTKKIVPFRGDDFLDGVRFLNMERERYERMK